MTVSDKGWQTTHSVKLTEANKKHQTLTYRTDSGIYCNQHRGACGPALCLGRAAISLLPSLSTSVVLILSQIAKIL